MRQRRLELMIEMMYYLDPKKYDLTFMLVASDKNYYEKLKRLASKHSNIHFVDPVAVSEIPKELNKYDIGVYILPPCGYNNMHALPNKFFEYVQACLAIAIGHSVEMIDYIDKYHLGVYADNFKPKNLAEEISRLSEKDILMYKQNCHRFAQDLSAEGNIQQLKNIIASLRE